MAVDLGVFERQKTVLDQQQLQEAFNLKKALAVQAAQRDALEMQALQSQAANGGLTLKDRLTMQMQQQNNAINQDLRRESMDIQRQNAEANQGLRQAAIESKSDAKNEKLDLKFRNDQNLMNNAISALDKQIYNVDALFDKDGNLLPDVANVYGTTLGLQTPIVYQGTRDAKTKLDQVSAGAFVGALGEMKNQSQTGASGLGSATEREGDKVQSSALSASDTKQSPESAAKALKLYRKNMAESKANLLNNFQNIYGDRLPNNAPIAPNQPASGYDLSTKAGQDKAIIELYQPAQPVVLSTDKQVDYKSKYGLK